MNNRHSNYKPSSSKSKPIPVLISALRLKIKVCFFNSSLQRIYVELHAMILVSSLERDNVW
ncbi:unnamed protein product [Clavelina lepadiformis]|uniref:Uncharacterized protein n=1 Tax=Clavelina lepadiformis TaxID=159417 RepID=A0ABP0GXZ5_CLALP